MKYLFALCFTFLATPLLSANVFAVDHPVCDYRLEGPIEDGDATQVAPLSSTYDGVVLCLNSPGGSLIEGRKIFDVIWDGNIKTRVLAEERCESACALAFLGGSINTGTANIRFQQRAIEPGARLGFHAPSLNLQSGGSYPAALVNNAFETALTSAEQIFAINLHEEHGVIAMNNFLYQRILTTRPESMYYISTIGDAVMANIEVVGAELPETPALENLTALCDNFWAANKQAARPDYTSAAQYFKEVRQGVYGTRNPKEIPEPDAFAAKVGDYYSSAKFWENGCLVKVDHDFRNYSEAEAQLEIYEFQTGNETPEDLDYSESFTVPVWHMLTPETQLTPLSP